MDCVTSLELGLDGSCEAVKKAGGTADFMYAGSVKDVESITVDTDGGITAITMKTNKGLVKFVGKMKKNSAEETITPEGEGNVNIYVHTAKPVLYHFTQADRKAIEQLFALDKAFFIVPTRAKQFLIYGLSKDADTFTSYGMTISEGSDNTGLLLNDMAAQTATFTGELEHKAVIFNESDTYANNLSAIDALLFA